MKRWIIVLLLLRYVIEGLRVEGDRLVNEEGRKVILVGTNLPQTSAENDCQIIELRRTGVDSIKSWGHNAVRIPIDEECWLGLRGTGIYQNKISELVEFVLHTNMYPILSLEDIGMPNTQFSIDTWASLAAKFANDLNVLFELFAEPESTDWNCWRFGSDFCSLPYRVAGMDRLVTTIRETGANNVLLLPGISKGTDLSNWLEFVPEQNQNLAASLRIFDHCLDLACWKLSLEPLNNQVPIIVDSILMKPELWRWLQDRNASYLAGTWSNNNDALSSLLEKNNDSPSVWGKAWYDWLQRHSSYYGTTPPTKTFNITTEVSPILFDDDWNDDNTIQNNDDEQLPDSSGIISDENTQQGREEPILLPDFYDTRHNILFSVKIAIGCALLFGLVVRWRRPRNNRVGDARLVRVSTYNGLAAKSLGGGSFEQLLSNPSSQSAFSTAHLSSSDSFTPAWESWLELEEDTADLLPSSSSASSFHDPPKRN